VIQELKCVNRSIGFDTPGSVPLILLWQCIIS
jgi:hypothetical protein